MNKLLKERWFADKIPVIYLMTIDKEDLIELLWYLRGYFKYDIERRNNVR